MIRCESASEEIFVVGEPSVHDDYMLSPYVVRDGTSFRCLIRLVKRDDDASKKISRIYGGRSADGITFVLDDTPIIAPGLRMKTLRDAKTRRS